VNGIKRCILAKHMYFSPCIILNDIVGNATTKIKLDGKREIKNTKIEHTTNLTWQ
jgi:hypothetical protein